MARWANLPYLAHTLPNDCSDCKSATCVILSIAMRVTFDSNVWQMAVTPSLASKTEFYADFVTVHDALRRKQIQGFISETVGTLEAIRKLGRKAYFSSIRPKVNVKVVNAAQGQAVLKIDIGTTHDQHPGLHRILEERLQLAIALGIRLMRAPRMAIPVPPLMLDLSVFADETDVTTVAARDNRWGDVMSTIEQRGVGSGLLRSLQEKAGGRVDDIEEKAFARAVAEWADGDSVAAHVAYGNDVFCTEDQGKNTGGKSILDMQNREWLAATHNVKFATIRDLAAAVRPAPFAGG